METVIIIITIINVVILIGMKKRRKKHFPKILTPRASTSDLRIIYEHPLLCHYIQKNPSPLLWESLDSFSRVSRSGLHCLRSLAEQLAVFLHPHRTETEPPVSSYRITFSCTSSCDWHQDGFGVRQLCGSLAVWPWANQFTSLGPCLLIWTLGVIWPTSQGYMVFSAHNECSQQS